MPFRPAVSAFTLRGSLGNRAGKGVALPMKSRSLLRIAAVLVVVWVLGYQRFAHRADGGDEAPKGAAIAANAREFTLGTLHFRACQLPQPRSAATTAAYCAPFQVPEDRDAPGADGRRIDLRVALIASDAEVADADVVVLLAGGPGQSAVESWPQVAAAFAPLLRHRHVLLLDQRGTGGSNALTCKAVDGAPDEGFDVARIRARTATCLAEVSKHADPKLYTTGMAVGDLESLRQALGAPRFDLVGVSYGTRVAQQYLRAFPDGVRSVVLDSAVGNEHALGSAFAVNLDDALKAHSAACIATPSCAKAFGDPWASLLRLRDVLRATPADVTYRDPVDHASKTLHLDEFSLATLARMYAYTPETSALLPLSVAQGLKGDFAPLVAQIQMLTTDLEGLSDNAMQLSVICSEDVDRITPDPADAGTLLGAQMVGALQAQCAIWPRGKRSADFNAPVQSDKPVLILSGELDPVTPPRYGEQIVRTLPNGRQLVARGQGHSVMGRGCFPRLVGLFVDKPDAKALDAGCIANFGPTPAFIDFNGAAP